MGRCRSKVFFEVHHLGVPASSLTMSRDLGMWEHGQRRSFRRWAERSSRCRMLSVLSTTSRGLNVKALRKHIAEGKPLKEFPEGKSLPATLPSLHLPDIPKG